jgi:hypothetical protein
MKTPTGKYEIVISEGCTAFYTSVNGKMVEDMAEKEYDQFVDYLLQEFKAKLKDSTVSLNDLIKCFQSDDWKYDDTACDQCGDSVTEVIWRI